MWIEEACKEFGFTSEQAEILWEEWKYQAGEGDTRLGYMDWLKHKIADAKDHLVTVADQALGVLEDHELGANNIRCSVKMDSVVRDLTNIINLVAPGLAVERERIRKEGKS